MLDVKEKTRLEKYRKYLKNIPLMYDAAEESKGKECVLERTAAYVLAPSVNGFVLWVLQEALKSGKKRLYFLARDGYLMYRTAKVLCEKLNANIECKYLCCSRYSIRIPIFQYDYEEALHYICRGGIDVNMIKILNRAGLSEAEQLEVMNDLNIPYSRTDFIPYAKLEDIKKELRKCEKFKQYLMEHSKKEMPNLSGYMKQEGLLDEIPIAIVDSGWVGSMQKTLNQLLRRMGRREPLEGYYWGLYELPKGVRRADYHCYYFTPETGMKEKVYFSNCLFEGVFSASHGMTLRYQFENTGYKPCYEKIDEERKKFIEQMEECLVRYTECLAGKLKDVNEIDGQAVKETIKKLFALFMGQPTKMEAERYGTLSFSDDVLEYGKQQIATLLTKKELNANHVLNKMLIMLGIKDGYVKESAWYEGSVARYGKHVEWHLIQYRLYKYLLYMRKKIVWRKEYGKRDK